MDWFSNYDRQGKLLSMILDYDKLCRAAIEKGAPAAELFAIGSREKIGRAKSVPEDLYVQAYAEMRETMEKEIDAVIEKAGETL